jgi:hypothetical protein
MASSNASNSCCLIRSRQSGQHVPEHRQHVEKGWVAAVLVGLPGQVGKLGVNLVAFGFQVGEGAQMALAHGLHGRAVGA